MSDTGKPLMAALMAIAGVLYLVASAGVMLNADSGVASIGIGVGVLFMLRTMDELGEMLNG